MATSYAHLRNYYERWRILMVLDLYASVTMIKAKMDKILANPEGTLYAINMLKLVYHHISRLPKKQR